jgi:hypothetical protein
MKMTFHCYGFLSQTLYSNVIMRTASDKTQLRTVCKIPDQYSSKWPLLIQKTKDKVKESPRNFHSL